LKKENKIDPPDGNQYDSTTHNHQGSPAGGYMKKIFQHNRTAYDDPALVSVYRIFLTRFRHGLDAKHI